MPDSNRKRMLQHVAAAVLYTRHEPPGFPVAANVVENIFEFVQRFQRVTKFQFWLILHVFCYGAFFYRFGCRTFMSMSVEQKERYLRVWEASRFYTVRVAFGFIAIFVLLFFYQDEAVSKHVGYYRPWQ